MHMVSVSKNYLFWTVLLLCGVLLVSCGAGKSTSQTQTAVSRGQASGTQPYPGPLVTPSTDMTYPGPAFITPVTPESNLSSDPLIVPQPKPGLGVVHGKLVAESAAAKAIIIGDYYLGPVIYTTGQQKLPFVSLDLQRDQPASMLNALNEFVFVDVTPGEYGIVIHTPVSDYVLPDGKGGILLFTVEPNKVIDLGEINIE